MLLKKFKVYCENDIKFLNLGLSYFDDPFPGFYLYLERKPQYNNNFSSFYAKSVERDLIKKVEEYNIKEFYNFFMNFYFRNYKETFILLLEKFNLDESCIKEEKDETIKMIESFQYLYEQANL